MDALRSVKESNEVLEDYNRSGLHGKTVLMGAFQRNGSIGSDEFATMDTRRTSLPDQRARNTRGTGAASHMTGHDTDPLAFRRVRIRRLPPHGRDG